MTSFCLSCIIILYHSTRILEGDDATGAGDGAEEIIELQSIELYASRLLKFSSQRSETESVKTR